MPRLHALPLNSVAFLCLLLAGCGGPPANQAVAPPNPGQMPPMPVKVAQPLAREVTEWDDYTGRIEAVESVEVKARVDGYLDQVLFRDGDHVKKGDLLFLIDQRPYRALLEQAQAFLEQARSRLARARNDKERGERLKQSRAISEEEFDARDKGLLENSAQVKAAEADVRTAQLNLEFTEIHAPIGGRIGRELITPGNLVKADDTILTQIVSLDPVYVYLDADERAALKYRRLTQAGKRAGVKEGKIPAQLALLDETGFPHQGVIDYADPRLDTGSGTLRVRGVFRNPDEFLSPGYFARVRMPGSEPYPALLLPEKAIGADQGQKFVWIAKDDGSIEYRRIVPGKPFGEYRAIAEGLKAEDKVVIEGIQKLRPGVRVQAEVVTLSAERMK